MTTIPGTLPGGLGASGAVFGAANTGEAKEHGNGVTRLSLVK